MDLNYLTDVDAGRKAAIAVPSSRLPGDWPTDPDQIFELPGYWREAAEMPGDVRERGSLAREHLWEMADQAGQGDRPWTEVMIASFAWGYVSAPYGPFRLRRILTDAANSAVLESSLLAAAGELHQDAISAYRLLRTRREDGGVRLKWYGPAFFTRFLFAAGGPGRPACILDQVRADAVRRFTDDPSLLRGSDWSTEEYAFYVGFVHELAACRS
ncbi:MAG TPA: hypothetical protein VMZ00_16670 [Sporichthya sp.]|nr:hypothetical protein [Sporichthya sp.]